MVVSEYDGVTAAELFVAPNMQMVSIRLADDRIGSCGTFGNFDLDPANDLALRNGELLPLPASFERIHGSYADSWRLRTAAESLFTYATGEGPETFYLPGFPDENFSLLDLSSLTRARASQICSEAGVTDAGLFQNCIFDVGISGDSAYAKPRLSWRRPDRRRPNRFEHHRSANRTHRSFRRQPPAI